MRNALTSSNLFSLGRATCAVLTCAAAVAVSTTLFAGPVALDTGKNVKEVAPAPPPPCNWTGFYIGLNVGYGWGYSKTSSSDDGFGEENRSVHTHPDGAVVGGQLGFNWQINNWFMVGLEASGGWLGLDDSKFIWQSPDNFATAEYNWDVLITPRLGVSFWNNRMLAYVKGGVAIVDLENRAGDLDTMPRSIDATENTRIEDTEVGWTVGTGFEFAFNCHWSFGIEYDYLGDLDRDSTRFDTDDERLKHYQHENEAHLITARLNYKFWGGR